MSYDPTNLNWQRPAPPPTVPYVYPAPQQSGPWAPPPPPPPQRPSKKPSPLLIVGILVAVVLGVCLFGAALNNFAGNDPVATATPHQATGDAAEPIADDDSQNFGIPAGTTMTVTGDDDSVQQVTLKGFKLRKSGCDSFAPKPEQGNYLIVDVLAVQKKGVGSVNPLYFTFVGTDGTTSDTLSGAFSGCGKSALDATNSLRAGQKRAGQIVFDVASASGTIEFAPGGFGAEVVGSWKTGN